MPNFDNVYSPSGYPWQPLTYGTLPGAQQNTSVKGSANVERKTPATIDLSNAEQYTNGQSRPYNVPGENILNSYRSVSYNFTFAALNKSQVNDPKSFDPQNPGFVIASTRGKKTAGSTQTPVAVATPPSTVARSSNVQATEADGNLVPVDNNTPTDTKIAEKQNQLTQNRQAQIESYNRISSGRFDMYIDNVDIMTTCAYTEETKTGLTSEIHMDIIEPYSINGFMESLQAGALWGGFNDYISGAYVLVMDFYGYPDDEGITEPKLIEEATRVFTVNVINAEIDINNRGTVYKVSLLPIGSNLFKHSISSNTRAMSINGKTVKEMLTDYATKRNTQLLDDNQTLNLEGSSIDTISVIFPTLDADGNPNVDSSGNVIGPENKIAAATWKHVTPPMNDVSTKGTAYQLSDQLKQPTSNSGIKIDSHSASFQSGVDVKTVIEAVVMDSSYIGDMLQTFYNSKGNVDSIVDKNDGTIQYFTVVGREINLPGNNVLTNKPPKKLVYMVLPRRMLYNSALPATGRQILSQKYIDNQTARVYNYIYTGKNTDVLDFKIQFNAAFFEELPKAMGASTANPSATSSAPSNSTDITANTTPNAIIQAPGIASQNPTSNASSNAPSDKVNATDSPKEPWQQIQRAMYDVINNSASGLITGDITILGDPYYLTDLSNGNSAPIKGGSSTKAVLNPSTGEVFILIKFQNPQDLNDGSGFMDFNRAQVGFSGLYKVITVRSEFKRGVFKQTLEIVRTPGQPQDSSQEASTPNSSWGSKVNPNDQSAVNSGPIPAPVNGNQINVNAVTSLPTATNSDPGSLSGSLTGASGAQNSVSSLYGIAPGNNTSALGIKANASALFSAQSSLNGPAALVTSAQKVLNQAIPGTSLAQVTSVASTLNSNLSRALNPNALAVSPSSAINQVGQNISQVLNGSVNNIANRFGVNPVGLTGLTGAISGALLGSLIGSGTGKKVATALGALAGLAATIPKNVNLQQATSQGLNLAGMTQQEIKNLPPIVAPQTPNLTSFIPTVSSVGINNPLANVATGPLASIQSGQLGSGLYQISQATNISTSVEGIQQLTSRVTGQSNSVGQSIVSSSQAGSISATSLSPLVNIVNA